MSYLENIIRQITSSSGSVSTLNLCYDTVGEAGAKEIIKALKINHSITSLKLRGTKIDETLAKEIAEALKINESISTLNLGNNKIGGTGAQDIAEALKINTSITTLNLGNIGETGAKGIAEALKTNVSITTLNLGFNDIGDSGAKDIAEVLKINDSITTLNLDNNKIGKTGAKNIAEALKTNHAITSFDLSNNRIGAAGAKDIAQALKYNHSITSLNLSYNMIGDAGAKNIAEALKINRSITTLNLFNNKINSDLAKYIEENLMINRSITSNGSKNIGDACEKDIAEVLEVNKKHAEEDRRYIFGKKIQVTDKETQPDKDENATIKEISSLIRDGNNGLQEQFKKGILLLGVTGPGKSTQAHLLSGKPLQAIMDDETGELVIDALQPLDYIVIGHKLASETKIPNKCLLKDLTIWDCPGFNDTDHVQELANHFYYKKLFETTELLKFVLVVPELVLNPANARGSIFLETLSYFIKSFNDIESIKGSVSLVVTHVPQQKNIQHIQKSIDKILTGNHNATNEHRALISKLKETGSIHLFYKPNEEGELTVRYMVGTPSLLATIDVSSSYCRVDDDMFNLAISKKSMDCSLHLLNITGDNLNQLLEVIEKSIGNAIQCLSINPLNAIPENYALVSGWIPSSIHYNNLPKHNNDEYFSELDFLIKLQKVLNCDPIGNISDAVIILQKAIEIFAEFADPDLHHKIQDYGYCLQQQFEFCKFFSGICKVELPSYEKLESFLTICFTNVTENLEYQVNSLTIDENQSDPDYFCKVIEYLKSCQDSTVCKKHKAVAYSCMASIAEKNDDQESVLIYCAKAIEANRNLSKIYESLGRLFLNKGEYLKAIDCYKIVNNKFRIETCFKAWLTQDPENPDIMLIQAEYFESIGLLEKAKDYYHDAFSLSQEENVKVGAFEKIGNIMLNAVALGENFITKAQERNLYNFAMVNDKFINNLLSLADSCILTAKE